MRHSPMGLALTIFVGGAIGILALCWDFLLHRFFFAVLADSLKALEVGAPLLPGLRIFSPEPALMRLRLA